MIKKNILGKTGIEVSVIGFGGAPLGDLFENLDDQVCYDILKNSHKNGINFFDTSNVKFVIIWKILVSLEYLLQI